MSESQTYRLDQAAPIASQQPGEQFSVPTAFARPEAETFLTDTTETVMQATSDAHQAYETAQPDERLVFTDARGSNYEIRSEQPEQITVNTQPNMLDDTYAEMIRERQEAAARQAEHAAETAQNVRAVAATGQIVSASREYAAQYGLAA